jgi:hypothetical protein
VGFREPVEFLYFMMMSEWERTAPPDGKQGLFEGKPVRNSQMARLVFLLKKISVGSEEKTFNTLSRYSCREDGESYISRNSGWMEQPCELYDGWYFEGCTSLRQKQDILQNLTKLGLSPTMVACADDFVAGKSIQKYNPTTEELKEIIADFKKGQRVEDKTGMIHIS